MTKPLSWIMNYLSISIQNFQPNQVITGIQSDSRSVRPGEIFFALNGMKKKGSEYINDARAKGAILTITDDHLVHNPYMNVYYSDKARLLMSEMAYAFFDNPEKKLKIIGITGTNGKTTTSYLIRHILSECGQAAGMIGTTGYFDTDGHHPLAHTTPESYQLASIFYHMSLQNIGTVVMEVSSHALALNRVAGLPFYIGVFTNITHDHLDFHQTMDHYIESKRKLFINLDPDAMAIVNADDPHTKQIISESSAKVITYGMSEDSDYNFEIIFQTLSNQRIKIGEYEVTTTLPGRFNAYNISAAFATSIQLGLTVEQISTAILSFSQVPGRFEKIYGMTGGVTGIVDYSHTPDSLENILNAISEQKLPGQRIITVFGCGGDRDQEKRPKMGAIAELNSDVCIVTSDNPRNENPVEIIQQIISGMRSKPTIIENRSEAIEAAVNIANPNDIILVAGKGHETYQEINGKRVPFDDRQILRESLIAHGK